MKKIFKIIAWSIGTFIAILILFIAGLFVYTEWFWQEWTPARIERVTGIRVPRYKIVEYNAGKRSFTGDYEDAFVLRFKRMPSEKMFDEIDKKIKAGNTGWKKEGDKYSFSVTWGNGYPMPKGENENTDGMFSITMKRGEKYGKITYGTW